MQEYIIERGEYATELEVKVNRRLQRGWKCLGGVAINHEGDLIQAMVKEPK